MKKRIYRRFAYVLVLFIKLICLFGYMNVLLAQDTIQFNAVEIKVNKIVISQIGKKTEVSDSAVKAQYKFSSLGDYLANNSSVFIKSYGPGGIATTAFRGGNASQTAVLWNGFNLQNTMLGQNDLTLLPNTLFDEIQVEYGGSSSVWGSGAIGGSIHLSSKPKFNNGIVTTLQLGATSIGGKNIVAKALISKKRFISSSKFYLTHSLNNYTYKDSTDYENPIKVAKHNSFVIKGMMQEFKFLIKNNQHLNVNAWIQSADRELPASDLQNNNKTSQADESIRLTADWQYFKFNFLSILRACYFQDRLNYTDSLQSLFSKSLTKTVMLESENYYTWFRTQQFNVSINALNSSVHTNNYVSRKEMTRLSLLLGNKFSFLSNKLTSYVSLRFEYYTPTKLPITGGLSCDYKLLENIHLKASASKVFRQPNLNELYWLPGGNENLKAEQGYTYEGEINYSKQIKKILLEISLAAYSRTISDWILWVPGVNGNPSPVNIQSVWSRGTESSWKLEYKKDRFKTGLVFMTSYVLSTVQSSSQENDNSVGKQLIYTPRYLFNSRLYTSYKNFSCFVFHNYTGYRFVTSDNSAWLNPYNTLSVKLNYAIPFKRLRLNVFGACNNILNTDYAVISNRPMPLRNYEIGISLQIKNKKT